MLPCHPLVQAGSAAYLATVCLPASQPERMAVCSPLVLHAPAAAAALLHGILSMLRHLVLSSGASPHVKRHSHRVQPRVELLRGTDLRGQETGVSDYYGEYKANTRAELKAKVRPKQDPGLAIDSTCLNRPRSTGCAAEDCSESIIPSCFCENPATTPWCKGCTLEAARP